LAIGKPGNLIPGGTGIGFLNSDFFRVGDDDVEAAAVDDGYLLVAIPGEGELETGGKGFVQAWRQDAVVGDVRQLPQGGEDGFARREDKGVLDEGAVRVLLGHGELGGDDGA